MLAVRHFGFYHKNYGVGRATLRLKYIRKGRKHSDLWTNIWNRYFSTKTLNPIHSETLLEDGKCRVFFSSVCKMDDGNKSVKCYLRMFAAFLACQICLSCSGLPLCFFPFTCDHDYFLASDLPKWLSLAFLMIAPLFFCLQHIKVFLWDISWSILPADTSCSLW